MSPTSSTSSKSSRPLSSLGNHHGYLFVAKGDLQQASGFFKIVFDEDPNNIPALLGQACVEFNQGESQEQYKATDSYKNSLKLFKRALQVHPNCPGAVRLGIALCRYRLDPESVEALVALGIMDLQTNEGLGQVQLKLGDFRSSLSSFEKVLAVFLENCECMKAVGHIYVQLGQNEKDLEIFSKIARIDPRDAQHRGQVSVAC
ncbi:uncharacterized protein A4U43_C06F10190 [Asparagus officinalis]|uniref:Uncharacterized protein n=1 Tax=Asparagus officinalis TaxID=4686 RepID=A0A5P1EKU7_ASPOF|nr:uncharacterized protein A4U43_C06F10190 [Asparagus officinalis]